MSTSFRKALDERNRCRQELADLMDEERKQAVRKSDTIKYVAVLCLVGGAIYAKKKLIPADLSPSAPTKISLQDTQEIFSEFKAQLASGNPQMIGGEAPPSPPKQGGYERRPDLPAHLQPMTGGPKGEYEKGNPIQLELAKRSLTQVFPLQKCEGRYFPLTPPQSAGLPPQRKARIQPFLATSYELKTAVPHHYSGNEREFPGL